MNSHPSIEHKNNTLHARKFIIWLFIVSSSMFFAALTSGFIVYSSSSAEKELNLILPKIFQISTLVLIISSITIHLAYSSIKNLKLIQCRIYIFYTILLGFLFFSLQLLAWQELMKQGVYFVNINASESFLYIFTGAHLLHVLLGIGMLIYTLVGSFQNYIIKKILFRVEVTSIFWHFIDVLWIYLYVFLILKQS